MRIKALRQPRLAMESIDFQTDLFGKDLERCVNVLLHKYKDGEFKSAKDFNKAPEIKTLEKIIYSRLGIKVGIVVDSLLAAIVPLYVNKNHIFVDKYFRGVFDIKDQNKLIKEMTDKKGWVDTKVAKVGGVFSDYEHKLFLNFSLLFSVPGAEAKHIVAVILHELGHAFYALEYSDRLSSNNQVLAEVASVLKDPNAKGKRNYVLKELKRTNLELTEDELDRLLNSNDSVILTNTWNTVLLDNVSSQMGDDKYDESSFEQLADEFTARFGYARESTEFLERLHRLFPDYSNSAFVFYFNRLMDLSVLASVPFVIFTGSVSLAFYVIFIAGILVLSSSTSAKDYTYDDIKDRYKRLRQQYIHRLKGIELPKEQLEKLIEDVKVMDRIIEQTRGYSSYLTSVANLLVPSGAKANRSIRRQQIMEELTMNDLFLKSAEFRLRA